MKRAKSRFGLVFQNFNLFPHYSVIKNVTDAPISVQKRPRAEAFERGRELLAKMGLADKEDMVPCELPAVSSSASRSPVRLRWILRCFLRRADECARPRAYARRAQSHPRPGC